MDRDVLTSLLEAVGASGGAAWRREPSLTSGAPVLRLATALGLEQVELARSPAIRDGLRRLVRVGGLHLDPVRREAWLEFDDGALYLAGLDPWDPERIRQALRRHGSP